MGVRVVSTFHAHSPTGSLCATPFRSIPADRPIRLIGPEMVGQRRHGLMSLVERIKRAV